MIQFLIFHLISQHFIGILNFRFIHSCIIHAFISFVRKLQSSVCNFSREASIFPGKEESSRNISLNLSSYKFFPSWSNKYFRPPSRLAFTSSCPLFWLQYLSLLKVHIRLHLTIGRLGLRVNRAIKDCHYH